MKTKIKILFLLIGIIANANSFAQYQRDWVVRYNGPVQNSIDQAYDICVDDDGNSYVTGYSSTDMTTIKYDASGNEEWVSRYDAGGWGEFPNVGYYITVGENDNSGNPYIYVTGSCRNENGDYDYATIKYRYDGSTVWYPAAKIYNGSGNGEDVARQIVVDPKVTLT